MKRKYQVIICGAGITGVSAAHFLAKAGVQDILLLDERAPLTLTSDRSTECYRNWWPDPEMLALMNRSIDLMEGLADECNNAFRMNRRGYLYITANENKVKQLEERSRRISKLGGGPVRIHSPGSSSYEPTRPEDFRSDLSGADILFGNDLIRRYFPYITERAAAALHVRRAGWLSAQQLGMTLLVSARRWGVEFQSARVDSVALENGRIHSVGLASGEQLECPIFVNAAGPYLASVGRMLGLDLPVYTELHLKLAFKDHLHVVGREAPLLIWDDEQHLAWDDSERELLAADDETRWLTGLFPAGAHTRPEGTGESQTILMLWDYKTRVLEPVFPNPLDDAYSEIALRGLATMLPRLREYFGRASRPVLDGGYYTRTPENRLLCGPLPIKGAYVIGAASGYGIMSACAAGELLSSHIAGTPLPSYAGAFSLARYDDQKYQKMLENWDDNGQL
jgi:sarcosine oxidase, subunit beta